MPKALIEYTVYSIHSEQYMGSFTETTEGLPEVSINQKLIDSLQPIRIGD